MVTYPTTRPLRLRDYQGIVPEEQLDRVQRLASELKGVRIMNVHSSADGGGVAEILHSLVPLMRDVGLDAQWMVMPGNEEFFGTTKRLHNLLQGADGALSKKEVSAYVGHGRDVAKALQCQGADADIWVMHDPQSLPMAAFLPHRQPSIWVCHIDTTAANQSAVEALVPWMEPYSLLVFSLSDYVLPQLPPQGVRVAPPAIDPLKIKNISPCPAAARDTMARLGLDPRRPIISQVARFDIWKDPWGVIDAYRLAREEIPGLQLALLGVIAALDDPEAFGVLEAVTRYADGDPDIHLFADGCQVGDREVAAVQAGADVILQKSLREGFGLTVAEALWKGTPVIGGNCGGIRLQIVDGQTGFLVDGVEECAQRLITLLGDKALAQNMGLAGKERVRHQFLLPRLLADYLEFFQQLMT